MGKKVTRREKDKYPALKPHLNLKTRYELVDYDYIDELSEKEKDWLNRFTEEYTHSKFDHDGARVQKKRKDELDSYQRNNSRNRDILTRAKASGKAVGLDLVKYLGQRSSSPEDRIIYQERLKELLSNKELLAQAEKNMDKLQFRKVIKELREKLKDLELTHDELNSSNNHSSDSQDE